MIQRKYDKVVKLCDLMLAKALEGTQARQVTSPGQLIGNVVRQVTCVFMIFAEACHFPFTDAASQTEATFGLATAMLVHRTGMPATVLKCLQSPLPTRTRLRAPNRVAKKSEALRMVVLSNARWCHRP
ncbi:hypothetical protein Pla52nx_000154 [Stieleria varia]|uniref:hypothetical protein n=1 Tax=Stieleria varia TaxID=2528005 RepID=UPI0011B5B9C3